MTDMSGPLAPRKERISVHLQLFAIVVAPAFWTAQLIFTYGFSSEACYPGDHPAPSLSAAAIRTFMIAFDVAAIVAAIVGIAVSVMSWRIARGDSGDLRYDSATTEGRERFMAIWGFFSSLAFLFAIVFNVIASLTVPPCGG